MITAGAIGILTPSARALFERRAPRYVAAVALPAWALLLLTPAGLIPSACLGGPAIDVLVDPRRLAGFMPPVLWYGHWFVMVCAMMLPLALPMMNYVEARSFPHRRAFALSAFISGHAAVWMAAGVVFYGITLLAIAERGTVAAIALGLSIAWHFSSSRARMLKACHRTHPLATQMPAAVVSAGRFGTAHGLHCVASCGHLMLPMLFGGHTALLALPVLAISLHERSLHRFDPRSGAFLLGLIWAVALV